MQNHAQAVLQNSSGDSNLRIAKISGLPLWMDSHAESTIEKIRKRGDALRVMLTDSLATVGAPDKLLVPGERDITLPEPPIPGKPGETLLLGLD